MTTEHTVVRSGKSKRKPFNSNVADYLLIIATFGPREERESNLLMSDGITAKLCAPGLMQPEDSVHGA